METTSPDEVAYELKMFYYRGLKEWNQSYLIDTCLTAQDVY